MLRIPCPKCGNYVFISDGSTFIPCPRCGVHFSGKHGPEKRKESRIPEKIKFSFSLDGRAYKASTCDLSEGGLGIQVPGRPPLTPKMVLTLTIRRPTIQGKIMWVKRLPDQSLAGLQKI